MSIKFNYSKTFGDLNIGDTFIFDECIYMKIRTTATNYNDNEIYGLDIEDGCAYQFEDDEGVIPIEFTLTI